MTLFDIFKWLGIVFGFSIGSMVGKAYFGPWGWLLCSILFAIGGLLLGSIPELWVMHQLRRLSPPFQEFLKERDLREESVEQIRTDLHAPGTLHVIPYFRELERRGEDLSTEIPFVLDMLCNTSRKRRIDGFATLLSVFPELSSQIPDYRFNDTPKECRRKVETLRRRLAGQVDPKVH